MNGVTNFPSAPQQAVAAPAERPPLAGDVLAACAAADVSALTRDVVDVFNAHPELASLPVVDAASGLPIGLINRASFMSSLARPFYKEIYLDRSCLVFMDREPLIVEAGMPLHEVSILIAQAGEKVVADGFLIVADGRYAGHGQTQDVLRIMADLHREQSLSLARHRDNLEELVLQRTQALTEARDAAEAAARAKSSFLANMSHEIRTPMNAIIGMTYLMARDGLPPRQAERLENIDQAARHLLGIINNILDLSKIGAGRLTLIEEPIDLRAIIDGVTSILGDLAQTKGLQLTIDAGTDDLPAGLCGDGTRVTQALLNYIGNAIKFTERGGVALSCRVVAEDQASVLMRFDVRDTGIGIAPEVMEKLFCAFRQADDSLSRKHGGTGLGLAITRHLAELMGGKAGGDSVPGQGSVFWFTARFSKSAGPAPAPRVHALPVKPDALAQLRQRYAGTHVLLVEDEPVNRAIAREFLESALLDVDFAADGSEAVTKASNRPVSLILMDMQMPVMDGLTATRVIRDMPYGRKTPIIAMTANAFAEDRARCLAAGMNDFIAKPFEPTAVYEKLLHWLDACRAGASTPLNRAIAAA